MDNKSKSIAWVGSMYQKFEDMCLEVDDVLHQDGFKCVETHLQMVGANVRQFCLDFVRDVLPQSIVGAVEGAATSSSSEQNTDGACGSPAKDIDKDRFMKEQRSASHSLHSSSLEHIEIPQSDSSLEEARDCGMHESSEASFQESYSGVKQLQAEMSDKIIPEEKDPRIPLLSPASNNPLESNSLTKIKPIDVPLTNSVSSVTSAECEMLDVELASSDSADEAINPFLTGAGKQDDSVNGLNVVESSCKVKLEESCILVDDSELSSVICQPGQHKSYKKKIKEAFTLRRRAAKQDHQQQDASHWKHDLTFNHPKESSASSGIIMSDGEFCESDWEII